MKIQTLAQAKVPKWTPFMKGKEASRWKKEGSADNMLKMKKGKKAKW